jgi:hypothetical protein
MKYVWNFWLQNDISRKKGKAYKYIFESLLVMHGVVHVWVCEGGKRMAIHSKLIDNTDLRSI